MLVAPSRVLWIGAVVLVLSPLQAEERSPAFDWDERWRYYLHRTYSFERIALLAADTAVEHAMGPRDCGRHPKCYPDHYGYAFARRIARTSIEFGVGGWLGEDIRRTPSGRSGLRGRVAYAMSHAYLARNSDGEYRLAYSRFAGTVGGLEVASAWQQKPFWCPGLAGAIASSMTSYVQDSLLAEFEPDIRRIGLRLARRSLRFAREVGGLRRAFRSPAEYQSSHSFETTTQPSSPSQ
jgi:hypothetical protein